MGTQSENPRAEDSQASRDELERQLAKAREAEDLAITALAAQSHPRMLPAGVAVRIERPTSTLDLKIGAEVECTDDESSFVAGTLFVRRTRRRAGEGG